MSAATEVLRFRQVAAQLAGNGYDPVPLYFRQKRPCAGDAWQNYKFVEADLDRFGSAGTGILCGRVVGLDIDVRDEQLACALDKLAEEEFGPAPRRIGQAPKVLRMLQTESPFSKLATRGYRLAGDGPEDKAHRVEILAQGQQFVAYNVHPDTKRPYIWNGAGDPLTVPIGLLPTISEARAKEFIAMAEQILAAHGRPVGKLVEADNQRPHERNEKQAADDPALLRSALAALPNNDLVYDDWIRVLFAAKGALGEAGLKDFMTWSAKSTKDVPDFSTREFKAARPTKIGAGTVFFLASAAGWKRPAGVAEHSWPEPVDIMQDLHAPPFTGEELPAAFAAYPLTYARSTGLDIGMALSAALAVAAAALDDGFQIVADSHTRWFQQPRLWILHIGRPGCGKTPTQKAMLAPFWDLQRQLHSEHALALRDCEDKDAVPPAPKLIIGDTTIEALSSVLKDNPRGVLVANDEFESWLGSLDAYRRGAVSRDRGEWLRIFDGGPHTIERVTRGSVFVPNWGASILTATTPSALRKMTRQLPEDGLLQRFIPILGSERREPAPSGSLEAPRLVYSELIRRLYEAVPRAHAGCVPMAIDAQHYFRDWLKQTTAMARGFGTIEPALESHFAKYPTFMLRIALMLHAAQIVMNDNRNSADPAAFSVSLETMQAAAKFLKRASLHAVALYLGRDGNEIHALARDVGKAILARQCIAVARRDLIGSVHAFRKAEPSAQDAVLRLLVDLGWLWPDDSGYTKAVPARYEVNPRLAEKFARIAAQERDRRAAVREMIAECAEQRRND